MKYTINQFKKDYPNDAVCLEVIFQNRFGKLEICPKCERVAKFYRVRKRQCYACKWCGYQLYPLAQTIFRKSTTSLWNWFYAIYLFSVSKNGVSAAELQRHIGVTYKTAWRMCRNIRLLMEQENTKLGGPGRTVEVDEVMIGGKSDSRHLNKTKVFGAVERSGHARTHITDWVSTNRATSFIESHLEKGTNLYTDGSTVYKWADDEYQHTSVNHSKKQWKIHDAHTNTIEGLWSFIQISLEGTYRGVSSKYLQNYLNEFIFRYNHREENIFRLMIKEAGKPS